MYCNDTSTNESASPFFKPPSAREQIWRSNNSPFEWSLAIECSSRPTKASSLTGIGVALGPFLTGLRIGLSAAKGIPWGRTCPSQHPLAEILAGSTRLRPADARIPARLVRRRYAYVRYHYKQGAWQAVDDITVNDLRAMAATIKSPTYVVGDMDAEERQILGRKLKSAKLVAPSLCLRRPAVLAELAWAKIQAGKADDAASLAPIYVHTLSNVPDL